MLRDLKYTGLVFLLFFALQASGQKNPSFVGMRIGPSIPYADFGPGGTVKTHAFAGLGGSIKSEIAYFYSPNVGVGFLAGFNIHPVDTDEFEKQVSGDQMAVSNLEIESQWYYSSNYMIGYYFNNPITYTILSFTSNIMIGFMWMRTPATNFHYDISHLASITVHQPSANNANFAFFFSLGLKAKLTEQFDLNLSGDYLGSKYNLNFHSIEGVEEVEKHLSLINVNLGLSYRF